MADQFAYCPIEFLGEVGGVYTYRCQTCSGACAIVEKTDTRAHLIDFECEHCGGPVGGCTDGFGSPPAPVIPGMDRVNFVDCGHGVHPLPTPIPNANAIKRGASFSIVHLGVAPYDVSDPTGTVVTKRARLFVLTHKYAGYSVHFGAESAEPATLAKYRLRSYCGHCHHIQLDSGPTFHVLSVRRP